MLKQVFGNWSTDFHHYPAAAPGGKLINPAAFTIPCLPQRKAIWGAMPRADSAPHSGTSPCAASSDSQNDFRFRREEISSTS